MKLSLLALVALSGSVAYCQCIGFVNKGDAFVNCKGRETRITHRGTVEQFAVAPNASALVLQHEQRPGRRIEIVSLKDGSSVWRPNRSTFDVTQSCGTVTGREWVEDANTFQLRDVLTDQLLVKSPYRQFACGADSKIVIGVTDRPPHLRIGTAPGHDLATIEQDNLVQFSISPDGQYVAYVTVRMELCASSITATNSGCVQVGVYPVAGLSINDEGSVLFGLGDDECVFGQHRAPNSCSNVFEWHAGQAESKRLMSGESPVWLTDSQASALAEFASKVTRSNHTARTTQH